MCVSDRFLEKHLREKSVQRLGVSFNLKVVTNAAVKSELLDGKQPPFIDFPFLIPATTHCKNSGDSWARHQCTVQIAAGLQRLIWWHSQPKTTFWRDLQEVNDHI